MGEITDKLSTLANAGAPFRFVGSGVSLSITAFAALALAFTPVQAANLHDNDYADDYQQYKADNEDMSIHDQYMDLMLKSKTAQYCVDTLGIKGGSEWPGSYWVRISLNWDSGFGKSRTSVSLSRGQRIRSVSGCLVSVTGD